MASYQFEIAGFSFVLEIPWQVTVTDNYLPFLRPQGSPWQERIIFSCVEEFPPVSAPARWTQGVGRTALEGKPCILRRLSEDSQPYVMEVETAKGDWHFLIRRNSNECPVTMQKVFNTISLEELLLRHDILLLHSSLIRWHDQAILFSAPSGTGKSTQADLWSKYEEADILNGDRSALRKVSGRWTAFGLPFAGSSAIYRDESAPIRTIVQLAQGPKNVIRRQRPAQALTKFYPEVTVHHWDKTYVERALELMLDLLQAIPVYALSCLPDYGAVQLLRDTINEVTI